MEYAFGSRICFQNISILWQAGVFRKRRNFEADWQRCPKGLSDQVDFNFTKVEGLISDLNKNMKAISKRADCFFVARSQRRKCERRSYYCWRRNSRTLGCDLSLSSAPPYSGGR